MNATISLDGLLSFIRSLSLSPDNKEWLAERLVEDARSEQAAEAKQSYAEVINDLCGAWSDDPRTPEEIATDIRQARQFGMTRHITPLCNDEKE